MTSITTLFLDVGEVLGTNGRDHGARERAAEKFHLDRSEVDEQHHLTFDTYEEGKMVWSVCNGTGRPSPGN